MIATHRVREKSVLNTGPDEGRTQALFSTLVIPAPKITRQGCQEFKGSLAGCVRLY